MKTITYLYTSEAIQAIREHFQNRNKARAIKSRVTLRKKFLDFADGNMIYTYTYNGETIKMSKGVSDTTVEF